MIDAEKLLGGLLKGSLKPSIGKLVKPGAGILPGKAAIGMGLLGVAIAAFEHFSEQNKPQGKDEPPVPVRGNPVPPPPPGAGAPPPAPPAMAPPPEATDPILLLRAMVASACADGSLDDAERERIVSRLESAGLTEEERSFMERELDSPRPLHEIVAAVTNRSDARQVYAVSLLAVEVDTDAERAYLETLRRALELDPQTAADIAGSVGR